jgi:hypothetical protein
MVVLSDTSSVRNSVCVGTILVVAQARITLGVGAVL